MSSWIEIPEKSPFTLDTLPYGIFSRAGDAPRAAVAIGDHLLDLFAVARAGLFDRVVADPIGLFGGPTLDRFAGAGPDAWSAVRDRIGVLLGSDNHEVRGDAILAPIAVFERSSVTMHRPIGVGDYVDFYSSLEHATNFGKIVRPQSDPISANYRALPIGYHGRSSTVVVSETPIVRPLGQTAPNPEPRFGPTAALDFELELGFITGPGNPLGEPIPIDEAGQHIFGCVVLNDWSARDIQMWEMQPLGPFLGKSFATSISPWVVPMQALEPFRVPARAQEPEPFAYLRTAQPWAFDIVLDVTLQSARMRDAGIAPFAISRANFKHMYWSMAQQLAHATINGTQIRPGDLYGSGTISNAEPGTYGSIFELTWGGTQPIALPSGEHRTFLEDGDTIAMSARCERGSLRVGFGDVRGTILPAKLR